MSLLTNPREMIDDEMMEGLDVGQRQHLESQFMELNQLQFNPGNLSPEKLNEEKMRRVDQLLIMLHNSIQ